MTMFSQQCIQHNAARNISGERLMEKTAIVCSRVIMDDLPPYNNQWTYSRLVGENRENGFSWRRRRNPYRFYSSKGNGGISMGTRRHVACLDLMVEEPSLMVRFHWTCS